MKKLIWFKHQKQRSTLPDFNELKQIVLIWDHFAFSIIRFFNLLIYIFYIDLILRLFSGMYLRIVRTSSYARLKDPLEILQYG